MVLSKYSLNMCWHLCANWLNELKTFEISESTCSESGPKPSKGHKQTPSQKTHPDHSVPDPISVYYSWSTAIVCLYHFGLMYLSTKNLGFLNFFHTWYLARYLNLAPILQFDFGPVLWKARPSTYLVEFSILPSCLAPECLLQLCRWRRRD